MIKLLFPKRLFTSFFLLLLWVLLYAPVLGAQFEEEVSTQEYLFVKGIIRSVSTEDQTITIKQKKGPKITVSIGQETLFEGFYKLEELKARQKIKAWYRPGEPRNTALKILKPLELGC